jgi:tyrosyl-tRNA synthetase
MDLDVRVALVSRNAREVLVPEEVRTLLETNEHPRAYIGFEPSGQLTVGHLVCARKMRDLEEAGCELTVFLADWHAWINDKLGGSLDRIQAAGRYMEAGFRSLGVGGSERTRFRWAHDLVGSAGYWERVIRVAKATSLARAKRAMTIMGRKEDEAQVDVAKLYYPSMQAADIFELPVEIAYAGMDQRRAHVLAREVAQHYGWTVPVAVHTPLISSLKGGARMDPNDPGSEGKMSKSDPTSSITIPSSPEVIRERIGKAVCPAREVEGNPVVELALYVLFPWEGHLAIERSAKYGGPVEYSEEKEFLAAWTAGTLHPMDLKNAVAAGLGRILEPTERFFADHPELVSAIQGPRPI